MQYRLSDLFALFLIYSFLGWCVEVVFVAVTSGRVVNRGFLNGPVCPIYGFGMLSVLILLEPVSDSLPALFFGGMALCSGVELIGGWLLQKVFDARWWDYSGKPLNLGGYICLGYSILWGLAVVFALRLIHPPILAVVEHLPPRLELALEIVLYALFAADMTVTVIAIAGIKRRIRELDRVAAALHSVGDSLSGRIGTTAIAADARWDDLRESGQARMAEGKEKVSAAIESGQARVAEGKEKVSAAIESGQERAAAAREELLSRRRELEEKQRRLLAEYRAYFSLRRLSSAFPDMREVLSRHLPGREHGGEPADNPQEPVAK